MYVLHHLGLGDHIICNGLVRELAKKHDYIILICKPHNLPSVEFMYRDIDNLYFLEFDDGEKAMEYLADKEKVLVGRYNGKYWSTNTLTSFDEIFYKQIEIPHSKRWSGFYVERDRAREKSLFEKYNVREGKYTFVHDDASRGFIIDEKYLNGKIIRPDRAFTDNIFDYIYLLQCARTIHCIDSSFRLLIDSVPIGADLYFHWYPRKATPFETPQTLRSWTRINE